MILVIILFELLITKLYKTLETEELSPVRTE